MDTQFKVWLEFNYIYVFCLVFLKEISIRKPSTQEGRGDEEDEIATHWSKQKSTVNINTVNSG
jgi:hypothetical protein